MNKLASSRSVLTAAAIQLPRRCRAVVGGVVEALLFVLSASVIMVTAAVVYVAATGSRLDLPGLALWTQEYRDSPSVVFQPHAASAVAAVVVAATACAVWRVRAAVSRSSLDRETASG